MKWFKRKHKPSLTRTEKLQALVDLTCHLYQHTPLKVAPTWFCGMEDDGYSPESYDIGWQNKYYLASIDIADDPSAGKPDYHFWLNIHKYGEKGYLMSEWLPITKDKYGTIEFKHPKLTEFVEFVNKNLHPKTEEIW